MLRRGYSIFAVLLWILSHVSGHPYFQNRIPNGKNVPSPCNASETWYGVGHLNIGGGGTRNSFGLAFAANNFTWNAAICQLDSDGDGRTNGEELGDPKCVWTSGPAPRTTKISHPGFCDPIDSLACSGSTTKCHTAFECPAIKAAGTFSVDINLPETAVPARETTYICMNFELPHDQPYHIVATTPLINNINVMHHLVAYECEVDNVAELKYGLEETFECLMVPDVKCQRVLGIWSFGSDGNCFDENAGFLVGGNGGFKYGAFQIHWNNPQMVNSYTDSSGMSFHMTPNLRPYNAGVMTVSQSQLVIPPGEPSVIQTGSCAPRCTQRGIKDRIYVTSTFNHMHLIGRSQTTELLRNGKRVSNLATDKVYDYNSPRFHDQATPVEVRPGDEIKTTCVFSSVHRNKTTFFGLSTSDEMCVAFLVYFPKEKLETASCSQIGDLEECDFASGIVNGCNFTTVSDPANPHYGKVFEYCRIEMCTKECLDYLRVKRAEPCFKGSVYRVFKAGIAQSTTNPSYLANTYKYYMLMDSCDHELAAERAGIQTDSAASIGPIIVPAITLAMAALLL